MASEQSEIQHSKTAPLFRRMLREMVRPYVKYLVLALFFMILFAAANGLPFFLLQSIIDDGFGGDVALLQNLAIAVGASFVLKGAASYAQEVIMGFVGLRITTDTQHRLYDHLLDQDIATFQAKHSGSMLSHFTFDITSMRGAVSNSIMALGRDLLSAVFLVGVMLSMDVELTLLVLVVAPVAVAPVTALGRRMRKVSSATQEEMGGLTSALSQSFQGIRMIKAYGMEAYEKGKVGGIFEAVMGLSMRATRIRAAVQPMIDIFGGIVAALLVIYVGSRAAGGELTTGQFIAFITAALAAYQPLRGISKVNTYIQEGLAAAQRIFTLLDRKPSIVDKDNASLVVREAGPVVFEKVLFSYDGEVNALDGLEMEAPAGKVTALVGASGAGKSTVLNLIPRFHDPNEGRVMLNGQDIRDVTIASLRDSIALVSQEVVLFDDTVMANIRYGRPDASDQDVFDAAQSASAHDFIGELPKGYDTIVGEHGAKLSGGQRQRLAIARAILKDAPVLLLDEATSALDTESERAIQVALRHLMKGRTTIVIAHRLSTITDADVIHVFDKGRVAETGNHDALLAKDGLYARYHALQFDGQAEGQTE